MQYYDVTVKSTCNARTHTRNSTHTLTLEPILQRCKPMAVAVPIPHIPLSRTHQRYELARTDSRKPKVSGKYCVHLAVSSGSCSGAGAAVAAVAALARVFLLLSVVVVVLGVAVSI